MRWLKRLLSARRVICRAEDDGVLPAGCVGIQAWSVRDDRDDSYLAGDGKSARVDLAESGGRQVGSQAVNAARLLAPPDIIRRTMQKRMDAEAGIRMAGPRVGR